MLEVREITKTFHAGTPNEVRANREVCAIYLGEGMLYDARHREEAGA